MVKGTLKCSVLCKSTENTELMSVSNKHARFLKYIFCYNNYESNNCLLQVT